MARLRRHLVWRAAVPNSAPMQMCPCTIPHRLAAPMLGLSMSLPAFTCAKVQDWRTESASYGRPAGIALPQPPSGMAVPARSNCSTIAVWLSRTRATG